LLAIDMMVSAKDTPRALFTDIKRDIVREMKLKPGIRLSGIYPHF
jgi:hypothetical protein